MPVPPLIVNTYYNPSQISGASVCINNLLCEVCSVTILALLKSVVTVLIASVMRLSESSDECMEV